MNLLSFNFDSCTQSHPHSLKAFEVKTCFQIFWTEDHKLQPTAKNRQKWTLIQNEGRKKADFRMNFKNETNIAKKKEKQTSFNLL